MSEGDSNTPNEYQLIGPTEDGRINDLLPGKTAKEGRQRLQALQAAIHQAGGPDLAKPLGWLGPVDIHLVATTPATG